VRIAWIDCAAGASGDMLLGAFLSAGADLELVNAAVAAVDPSLSVTVEQTARHQIAATKASVRVAGELHPENFPDGLAPASAGASDRAEGQGTPVQASAGHGHGHAGDAHGHGHGEAGHGHGDAAGGHTRTWAEVRRLIEGAGLTDAVRERALDTFARLARAEGAAHGVEPDEVHFHEVGSRFVGSTVGFRCRGLQCSRCCPRQRRPSSVAARHTR
jgi:uncharacterized protein (DUF111 family)